MGIPWGDDHRKTGWPQKKGTRKESLNTQPGREGAIQVPKVMTENTLSSFLYLLSVLFFSGLFHRGIPPG